MGFLTLLLLALCHGGMSAYCNGKPKANATQNVNPIFNGAPKLIKSINCCLPTEPNCGCAGHLYQLNDGENAIPVLHVYGTPYQWGYAQGLLRPDAKNFIDDVYAYLDESAYEAVNGTGDYPDWMPLWFFDDIVNLGVDGALQLELDATMPYTPQYFIDELTGLSKSSGTPLQKLEWVHLIGELTKGSCSMFGAWGAAIPNNYSLIQLRALDWDMDGPFRDYPQVTVYHPNVGSGHPFANVGYAGFIGSFSGMSSIPMATSEIGVSYPDDTFGRESRFGIPFTYILRDFLQWDNSLNESLTRITNANRTCDLILGVGDGVNAAFRGIEYSASTANFYTDTDMMPEADWHPRINNTVYYGMDWLCPNYDEVLAQQITYAYGQITPELGIKNITAILTSGDNFVSYYDLTPGHPTMFTSFAGAHGCSGAPEAYNRQFSSLDMKALFSTPPPTQEQVEATKDVKWTDPRLPLGFKYNPKMKTTDKRKFK
jgi:hypothetical protein